MKFKGREAAGEMSSWFSTGATFLRRSVVNPCVATIAEKAYPKRAQVPPPPPPSLLSAQPAALSNGFLLTRDVQRGLWGGKKIGFGNNVSDAGNK